MYKFGTILTAWLLAATIGWAAVPQEGVIPYPPGTDTKTEGASSVPAEINHQDSIYFTQVDYYTLQSNKTRTMLSKYPTYQQTRENTCGPAAALTVLVYYGDKVNTEASLSKAMHTKPCPIGTNVKDMVRSFERMGWTTESSLSHKGFDTYEKFQSFVLTNLKKGRPIMVENIEWGGHWRVIIGYDTMGTASLLDDVLIMADPYDTADHRQDGYAINNGEKFYSMWMDHSMLPKDQAYQPWIITYPKE